MLRFAFLLLVLAVSRVEVAPAATCALSHWGDQSSSAEGLFSGLRGLAVNRQTGQLLAADGGNNRVEYFDARACESGSPNACFLRLSGLGAAPSGIAWADDGTAYVTLEGANQLVKLDPSGSEVSPRRATTYSPTLVVFDEIARRVWASSPGSSTIFCYDEDLQPQPVANISFTMDHPQGLFVRDGFLYVTTDLDNVYRIELAAPPSSRVPLFSTSSTSAHSTWGIVVDVRGDIFIANRDSGVVNQYDESGYLLSSLTLLSGSAPQSLAIDEAGAFLYVSEAGYRVERFGLRRAVGDCLTAVERVTWSGIKLRSWAR